MEFGTGQHQGVGVSERLRTLAREKGGQGGPQQGNQSLHHPPCGPFLGQPVTPLGKMGSKDAPSSETTTWALRQNESWG